MKREEILKKVLQTEVFPALGCTEPIAVAYTASVARHAVKGEVESVSIVTDPRVYKNGFAVTVPNTNGQKGNLIAGAIGALIGNPEFKMEILQACNPSICRNAQELVERQNASITFDTDKEELYIEVMVTTKNGIGRAIVEGSHTNVVYVEVNGKVLIDNRVDQKEQKNDSYRKLLGTMTIADLMDLVEEIDEDDYQYILKGVEMNLRISDAGMDLQKVGYYIHDLIEKSFVSDDVFARAKVLTASAVDARMAGLNYPVMSSGGSGNQGIVAILLPYHLGKHMKVPEATIVKSIAFSHLINSYIKYYTGDLSPLCGCSIAAGVGAAAAIVYQMHGRDMQKITYAINNLISDLGGMLCDGAKGGCALKVASSTDSALRSAYMAINNCGIDEKDGFVGTSAELTIQHLSEISNLGMQKVDNTMLGIMLEKTLGTKKEPRKNLD